MARSWEFLGFPGSSRGGSRQFPAATGIPTEFPRGSRELPWRSRLSVDATIFVRLRASVQNIRFGRRIRSAMLDEKVVLRMRGINEYQGRLALLR